MTRPGSGHSAQVSSVADDGEQFATMSADQRICVWKRRHPEPQHTLDVEDRISYDSAVLLTGEELYAGTARGVHRWVLGDARPRASLRGLKDDVAVILPLPDRGLLLVGSWNRRRTHLRHVLPARPADAGDPRGEAQRPGHRPGLVRPGRTDLRDGRSWHRRCIDIATPEVVDEVRLHTDNKGRKPFPTPHGDLLVETQIGRDASLLFVSDTATRECLHGGSRTEDGLEIPDLAGMPAMSTHGRFATSHADAVRPWDYRAGTVERELPLVKAADGGTRLHWFADDEAILVCYQSGAIHHLPL